MTAAPTALAADRRPWLVVIAIPVVAYLVGAVALPSPRGAPDVDRSAAAGVVLATPATPSSRTNVILGERVRVRGADLPRAVERGDRLDATFHFEALQGLDRDWQIFLHIDQKGAAYRIHGDHFPADGRYPTTQWRQGEHIADRFTTQVPLDAPSGTYEVWLGFYLGNERLPFTGGDASAHDGENRVRVGTLQIEAP